MFTQADKDKLKKLGLDPEAIEAAAKADTETAITVPEGSVLTDAQVAEIRTVERKEGKTEGEGIAKTALIKEVAAKTGLTITGERIADLVTGIKEGLGKDKDAAFKTLQDQNTALLADNEKYKGEVVQAKNALEMGLFEVGILSKIPAHAAGLTPKESFELAKMRGYTPEKTDAGVVWKKGNEVLKDPVTHAPLAEDKAIAHIWETEKWNAGAPPPPSGRGGTDGNPSGAGVSTLSSATEQWKRENPGKNEVSPEFTAYVGALAKADANFKWDA